VNAFAGRAAQAVTSIRVRLAFALCLALLPVLIIGGMQSIFAFRAEADSRRQSLELAAGQSAANARTRIEAAGVLLQTLGPGSVGLECAQRLADVRARLPGYANLIRFDSRGRVACAAATTPFDTQRGARPWFQQLRDGATMVVASDPGAVYANEPAVLAAIRAGAPDRFEGAMAAVLTLGDLKVGTVNRFMPDGAEVALADSNGAIFAATDPSAFSTPPRGWRERAAKSGAAIWSHEDAAHHERTYSAAPLVDDDVFVVLSAPAPGLVSWAWINPISRLLLPLLAFFLALGAVLIVAEREVIRWIVYLQRVAAIYAKGRFTDPAAAGRARAARDPRPGPDPRRHGRRHRHPRRLADGQPGREGRADARDPSPGEEQPADHHLAAEHAAAGPGRSRGQGGDERHPPADHRPGPDLSRSLPGTGPQARRPAAVPGRADGAAAGQRHEHLAAGADRGPCRPAGHRSGPPGADRPVRGRGHHQRPEARLRADAAAR
jgi:hypothetical protein